MTDGIFRGPGGGRRAWIFLLIAGYFLVEIVFFREGASDRLVYLVFGLAVLGLGLAELVPRDRAGLAGMLRIGGGILVVLALVVRVAQLATSAG